MPKLPPWTEVLFVAAIVLMAAAFATNFLPHSHTPAAVTKAAPAIVNTVQSAQARDDATRAQVKEITRYVTQTSAASSDMGDTGRAGLTGLCELRTYSETAYCRKLFSADPGQRQEAGSGSASASEQ